MSEPDLAPPSVDEVVDAVMRRDEIEAGFALGILKGIVRRLPDAEAAQLIGLKLPKASPCDPAALIG